MKIITIAYNFVKITSKGIVTTAPTLLLSPSPFACKKIIMMQDTKWIEIKKPTEMNVVRNNYCLLILIFFPQNCFLQFFYLNLF